MPIVLVTPTQVQNTFTSGTVGETVIDTAKLLEHAFRRAKIHPSRQTPELVAIAKQNLYLILLNLANRGINLWCTQSDLMGLASGKQVYATNPGTIDVLNLIYCQPTRAVGTDTSTVTSFTTELASATQIRRVGFRFSAISPTESVALQTSDDGVTFSTVQTFTRSDWEPGKWFWYDLDTFTTATYFRIETLSAITVIEFYLASAVADLPVVQWNRDTWSVLNNKAQQGRPSTNYYFEKLLTPRFSLWPVPNNDYDHVQVFVQRQVQDVGTLAQQIEVPQRWMEAVIWQLALRLLFEVPEAEPTLIPVVQTMADKVLLEAEHEEGDGAPIVLGPNISVYTK